MLPTKQWSNCNLASIHNFSPQLRKYKRSQCRCFICSSGWPHTLVYMAVTTVPSGSSKESHGVESGHVIGNMDSVGRGKCAHISLCTCMQE